MRKPTILLTTALAALILTGCANSTSSPSPSGSATATPPGVSASAAATPSTSAQGEASANAAEPSQGEATIPAGFPTALIPVIPKSQVRSAELEPVAKSNPATEKVSLILESPLTPPQTLEFYDKAFTKAGFTQINQSNGSTTFSRDYARSDTGETLNLNINWPSGKVIVTTGGQIAQGSGK